jgi:uracil-DNA glycosylase
MDPSKPSAAEIWKALNILDDFLSGGFIREHPELIAAPAPDAADAGAPAMGSPAAAGQDAAPVRAAAAVPAGDSLASVAEAVSGCTACALCTGRKTAVPGEGSAEPLVLLVGEGPGEEEDKSGRPFVGRAGQYLDSWLKPIGLDRASCFVTNVVKCRPPQNREPRPEEIQACAPYLDRQIALLKPTLILCLGRIAAHRLLEGNASLGALRGKVHSLSGVPLVVTYHPSAVLRDQALKRPVWEDLKLLKSLL